MYKGDRSRKETLVGFGFRLPSALDNRPLRFDEFKSRISQIIYVSATPADYEVEISDGAVVEQIVRPTGLIDPVIEFRDAKKQVDDLYEEIQLRIEKKERVLVTTLTKRMAEDLTDYYSELGITVRYLHSDIKTLERLEIIQDLRTGEFDVLIGINLLREGLDIPEVSLVAILDADKEGFLRSARSLIQICGRASRNINGKVLMYAEGVTPSMQMAVDETVRRRKIQEKFNRDHNITPMTIKKEITAGLISSFYSQSDTQRYQVEEKMSDYTSYESLETQIKSLEKQMNAAAKELQFEKAAELRDRIREMKKLIIFDFEVKP